MKYNRPVPFQIDMHELGPRYDPTLLKLISGLRKDIYYKDKALHRKTKKILLMNEKIGQLEFFIRQLKWELQATEARCNAAERALGRTVE